MFEKNLAVSDLLDQYGSVIGERPRLLLDYYYNQDLSLAEIAAEVGISRQGVRDSIKKAEEELFFLESRLHLLARDVEMARAGNALLALPMSEDVRREVLALMRAAGLDTN